MQSCPRPSEARRDGVFVRLREEGSRINEPQLREESPARRYRQAHPLPYKTMLQFLRGTAQKTDRLEEAVDVSCPYSPTAQSAAAEMPLPLAWVAFHS